MLKFSLSLLPFGIAIVISCYYFADPSYGLTHPGLSRSMLGIYLATRMLSLALISFMWLSHCNVRALILELTAKKILTVHLGFALLAVINAKASLAAQFQQIQLAYRMRYQRGNYSPKILLPLLVAAARYAQTLSISLACRGLNPARSYHQSLAPLAIHDWCILLANLVIMLIILILL
jgi:energy-coupling factor transporter transmembrane protein EcfT